ncbi:MAG: cyclic beta 1-2 glucan synthetase [Acidobacteria bacterium]|nr:cyclic beta 1-2 glucan synthetase [Acidobacteriota bacterium]
MELHANHLAKSHRINPAPGPDRLLNRLAENEDILMDVHARLMEAVQAKRRIPPAGEWIFDNFYLIEEQIRTAKRHLPKGYSRELPRLLTGPSAGLPRVYDVVLEAIAHGDGRVDPESLRHFVTAYQAITPLTLGELWAIPIMLRLALIENLRRVGSRITSDWSTRNRAARWADLMMETAEKDPKGLILVVADMARSNPLLVSSFVAEFVRRVQGRSPTLKLPITWIEQRLAETGQTIEHLVQSENQQQAADQVSIGNSIGSLRFLGGMDWREFVEAMSIVEQILRTDPAEVYSRMDFSTRDAYRHVVEQIAKHSPHTETETARQVVQLSQASASQHGDTDRAAHIGFFLVGPGLQKLEQRLKRRLPVAEVLQRAGCQFPLTFYLGPILVLMATLTFLWITAARSIGIPGWQLAVTGGFALVSTLHLAVALMNWFATLTVKPHSLPRLDFSKGIPPDCRTLVVVPTMLTSVQGVERLLEALEVRFLANRDPNLRFALLTDFRDSAQEVIPSQDAALIAQAQQGIEALNKQYCDNDEDRSGPFFLFHRPRRWNLPQGTWMGYERKRGKLAELNALLLDGSEDRFAVVVGDRTRLSGIQYVITLDTDTHLPRNSARQFVGAMAHPLNQARHQAKTNCVNLGYGILQPHVTVSMSGLNRSRYAKLFGGETGIDPYTHTVSDVYQDVFGEGSFIGKGIYDVAAFETALKDRFPENRILSHDLLEGCYARSGLLSEVELHEEFPASYSADVSRRHRWIRGDWQIAEWLLPRVSISGGGRAWNPLSLLSRWKIFDNLRRSLTPATLMMLLLFVWAFLSPVWVWTCAVVGILLIPPVLVALPDLFQKPADRRLRPHLSLVMHTTVRNLSQAVFGLAMLPFEAVFSLDAVVRTLWRVLISHKHLLEWNPSIDAERQAPTDLIGLYRLMWSAPAIALMAAVWLAFFRPEALIVAAPLLVLWLVAPALAWWISQPIARHEATLTVEQSVFLRKLARKTWGFFEQFVGQDDHWLPPDNFQEHPNPVIAHRTSPTNIGLALLANVTAHDFGYITTTQLINRTTNTLNTMDRLERHRGHFYNWYDTQTLVPLPPLYVSSVDSGNLAGHLLILRTALLDLPDRPIVGPRLFEGISDTLEILTDALNDSTSTQLLRLHARIGAACSSPRTTLGEVRRGLEGLLKVGEEMIQTLTPSSGKEKVHWASVLTQHCREALDELQFLAPWIIHPDAVQVGMNDILTLRQLATLTIPSSKDQLVGNELRRLVSHSRLRAAERLKELDELAGRSGDLAQMEYDFLFDPTRKLLATGYNVGERRLDSSYYDLLASEARLSSFVGIAQGRLPQEHWFALGRLLTTADGGPTLLSWSGSMFEYLMPLLVMPTFDDTLLDQTYRASVKTQIEYGRKNGVAWGVSESGYNIVDLHLNYQYRAFGVPGLGFKRGLAEDLVIAPYASALALMVAPQEACRNLQRLTAEGVEGEYGLYEAVDYTLTRVPPGQSTAIVRSFMAHHQGMSFLSMAYVLLNRPMQKRFEAEPLFKATMLLLQERVPKTTEFYSPPEETTEVHTGPKNSDRPLRIYKNPNSRVPEVQLLSNGRYHVMLTNSGGGYSRWKDLSITRWREDTTRDNWGTFCYLRNVTSGEYWSTSYQPTLKQTEHYEAIFSEGRGEFRNRNAGIDTHTEVAVSPEDDIELRRVRITNTGRTRVVLEITSFAEVVLTSSAADALHPAFSKLFVQTEILSQRQAIVCARRPRSEHELTVCMFHLMTVHNAEINKVSYETDRARFIGRGNTLVNPLAMSETGPLSGSEGSVLDPIVAIRYQIILEPETSATVNIVTGIGETRDLCLGLVEKYQDWRIAGRVFDLAWTHSHVTLRHLNATEADAHLYCDLARSILYANATLRAEASLLIQNRRGQSGLWGYSISGDLPIVLLKIGDPSNIDLVRRLIQAHSYWRHKGLAVDLVIWNEDRTGYQQLLHDQIMQLIPATIESGSMERPGGIFVRPIDQVSAEDRILVHSVARVILSDRLGTLADQLKLRGPIEPEIPLLIPVRNRRIEIPVGGSPRDDLIFFNGLGGFTRDGREYVITTAHGQSTPVPWVNVLANPGFGSVISESGAAYTWSENAHEYRLTPWHNDPVSDSSGEAFFIREEDTGYYWSPTPLPVRGGTPYACRHGFGYSVFEHTEHGISSELWTYVALKEPVKFIVLKLRNDSGRMRRLSVTGYVEWVLGDLPPKTAMHLSTELDPLSGAILARNTYNTEFPGRVAFFDVDDPTRTFTGSRTEFIGRNQTLQNPAALKRSRLSGKLGAALDPCTALQMAFDLAGGETREIVFLLGVGTDAAQATQLARQFRGPKAARLALEQVWDYWKHTLGAVHVETPDQSLNVLTNGWLLYQTLACRMWARSGYYQSGGAFGFRDQLQDVMALIHIDPQAVRAHLLVCASRQFPEGDVQHWWHPPMGRGVRTKCSDDYLWLPLATHRYVTSTGDTGVLDEPVAFVEGRELNPEEESYYNLPNQSERLATLYEHCRLAIERGLKFGDHGLPFIGSGDWNDGMNLVGEHGTGESVWLGFFLYQVLVRFAVVARGHQDISFASHCDQTAARLRENLEQHGWDGGWYRRAYFDDGTPLGSATNAECQIDSIAQSWSVLSGAGDRAHSRQGMEALNQRLVRREQRLIQLLDPPFDISDLNPGYIKGYVPGVRENGGQYTHAAIWAAMAFAELGEGERAWELFSIINPINHGRSPEAMTVYKVEPYVIAADVYARPPHVGRGGWTWYTGSAGWMYRLILESLLGLNLEVDTLSLTPCLPANWDGYTIHYRFRETVYHITIRRISDPTLEKPGMTVDGQAQEGQALLLIDDRKEHTVEVTILYHLGLRVSG